MVQIPVGLIVLAIGIIISLIGVVYGIMVSRIGKAEVKATAAHLKAMELESKITLIESSCQIHKSDILTIERFSIWTKEFEGGLDKKIADSFRGFEDNLFRKLLEGSYIQPKGNQRKAKA